ncbi:MAG: endosialidase [Lachnospiraceae bacterium]|nr:endosialidase [Lachnospiraceae bacterium]
MGAISELIRKEENGTISFGDYTLDKKAKLDNFEYNGDLYKVKTFREITKLERNGMFVYESVPGTTVSELSVKDNGISFLVEGPEDAQITLELEESAEYEIFVNNSNAGKMKTNLGGKLSLSVELETESQVAVRVEKC